jgi:hypothetical protein
MCRAPSRELGALFEQIHFYSGSGKTIRLKMVTSRDVTAQLVVRSPLALPC